MKKIGAIIVIILIFNGFVFSQVATVPTFDVSTWMASLDQLYSTYDEINNMITMIQQNYEQIQFALDRAKSFNWNSIDFNFNDGSLWSSLDIRDEITSATASVDRKLDQLEQLKNAFTNKNITVGGQQFSIADLCCVGDNNLGDFVSSVFDSFDTSFDKAAQLWEDGLTDEQAAFIWSKYGLKPKNYYKIQAAKSKANEVTLSALSRTEETAEALDADYQRSRKIAGILEIIGTGDATDGEFAQANALLLKELCERIDKFIELQGVAISQEIYAQQVRDIYEELIKEQEKEANQAMSSSNDNVRKAHLSSSKIKSSSFSATGNYFNSK